MVCAHHIVPIHSSSGEHQLRATTNNPAENTLILIPFWTCKELVLYYLAKELLGYRVWFYLMCPSNAK